MCVGGVGVGEEKRKKKSILCNVDNFYFTARVKIDAKR